VPFFIARSKLVNQIYIALYTVNIYMGIYVEISGTMRG
jgi:hypothetical protein